jgi:hypothetical protein
VHVQVIGINQIYAQLYSTLLGLRKKRLLQASHVDRLRILYSRPPFQDVVPRDDSRFADGWGRVTLTSGKQHGLGRRKEQMTAQDQYSCKAVLVLSDESDLINAVRRRLTAKTTPDHVR